MPFFLCRFIAITLTCNVDIPCYTRSNLIPLQSNSPLMAIGSSLQWVIQSKERGW